jgi:hypothetical protein
LQKDFCNEDRRPGGPLSGEKLPLPCDLPRQPVTDAVEKVRGTLLTRNNRIILVDFSNRTCAFHADFESILLRDHPKSFFDSIDPEQNR